MRDIRGQNMKPQDVLIILKILFWKQDRWTFEDIASSIFMSRSEVFQGVKRLELVRLLDPQTRRPRKTLLLEFLLHGLKFVFPASIGQMTKGILTAHSGPALKQQISADPENCFVWPVKGKKEKGLALTPLYPSVPKAALNDRELYEILTLLDAIRMGKTREVDLATQILEERILKG